MFGDVSYGQGLCENWGLNGRFLRDLSITLGWKGSGIVMSCEFGSFFRRIWSF